MALDPTKIPIRASTQEHLDIEDIKDDIVIFKDGGACLLLSTTAVNFGLLSEKEQDASIYAYAALLNSLTFPIQIVIRSTKKDISSYLKLLEEQEKRRKEKLMVEQIKKYRAFVEETVKQNEVLDKEFYLVIPMTALELGATKAVTSAFKRKRGLPFPKDYIIERAKTILYPKRDHLIRQLNRLGLKSRQLTSQELIELFFSVYNPEARRQKLTAASEYKTPLVEPAIATPPPLPTQPTPTPPTPPSPLPPTQPTPTPPIQPSPPSEPEKMSAEPADDVPLEGEALQRQIDNLITSVKRK